ncbi:MarR family winged helix-turn-helix transcriptional regulator [Actinoplanes regularis]|uniref:MarR family winged helix-turn-helix transcriptional regulator n=1 Tax=Actinoplanes regularis TaxID=52697 RepID=UPI0024A0D391|nr:MarR family transcriptional regulator [Actinoplanes regularis]GLW30366.1 putative HTH-type transcriptional regulator YcgE [Actinoplanes regularis]
MANVPPPELPAGAHETFRRYLDAVTVHTQAAADAARMHPTDWAALSALNLAGRLTSGELAERTGLTSGATTRLIDRLERAGHVRRVPDPADRRRVVVEPQPKLDVAPIVTPGRQRVGEVFQRYRPEELAVLFDYFGRAADAFLAAAHDLRARPASPEQTAQSTRDQRS